MRWCLDLTRFGVVCGNGACETVGWMVSYTSGVGSDISLLGRGSVDTEIYNPIILCGRDISISTGLCGDNEGLIEFGAWKWVVGLLGGC
jgi:hypothetical protein